MKRERYFARCRKMPKSSKECDDCTTRRGQSSPPRGHPEKNNHFAPCTFKSTRDARKIYLHIVHSLCFICGRYNLCF